jgi:hypothetical protein
VRIGIPADEREGFRRLAALSDAQVAALKEKLANVKLLLDRDEFASVIRPIEGVADKDLEQIIGAVLFIHSFPGSNEYPLPDFVRDVTESVEAEDARFKGLAQRLESLLAVENLRLRSKAVDLLVDHSQTFQGARVFTDVRPVFDSTASNVIRGALVFHTLKIDYYRDSEPREAFFALDERDVATLTTILARAEVKARTIREKLLSPLNITDFGTAPKGDTK